MDTGRAREGVRELSQLASWHKQAGHHQELCNRLRLGNSQSVLNQFISDCRHGRVVLNSR